MGKKRVAQKGEAPVDGQGGRGAPGKESARRLSRGVIHIRATYNNTFISTTDDRGGVVAWSSAGSLGFSGAKKATPFAAARVADTVADKLAKTGLQDVTIVVSGVGSGRDSAIRAFANRGFNILAIRDETPAPHNGPRPPKPRRV